MPYGEHAAALELLGDLGHTQARHKSKSRSVNYGGLSSSLLLPSLNVTVDWMAKPGLVMPDLQSLAKNAGGNALMT